MLGVSVLSAAIGSAVLGVSAPTIYDNYQSFPLGSRAAGMGGAYTALGCDEGALHYNPGALSCAEASHLELVASAYAIQGYNVPDALGLDTTISASTYHSLPSMVGGVRILDPGDPESGAGRLAFGLLVEAPRTLLIEVDPPNPDRKNSLTLSVRDDLIVGQIGLGYQLTRSLGIGVALAGVVRTFDSKLSELVVRDSSVPCGTAQACADYVTVDLNQSVLALGGRATVGVRWAPSRELSFGLVLTSPTVELAGSSKLSSSVGFVLTPETSGTVWGAAPTRAAGASEVALPARIAFGAAYSTPSLTLSLDVSANFARDVRIAHDLQQVAIEDLPPSTTPISDTVFHPGFQPNVNLGLELPISEHLSFAAGLFTDLSSVGDADVATQTLDRIDLFGGSAAIGFLGRESKLWLGLSFEYGVGTTPVPSGAFTLEQVLMGAEQREPSTVTRWSLVGIIGSSYAFLGE